MTTESLPGWIILWKTLSALKTFVRKSSNFYKKFVRKSSSMYNLWAFKNLQNYLSQSIQIATQNNVNKITQRLGGPKTRSKCYWSLLKTLLNGNKIPTFLLYFIVIYIEKKKHFQLFFRWPMFSDFEQKRLAFLITTADR